MCMLLFLLLILISSAITLPTSKKILEFKYQATSKRVLNDQNLQENLIEKLRQIVKRYWIMAETGSPQFVMASNSLSSASGIICVISMSMHMFMVLKLLIFGGFLDFRSVYKWSVTAIVITQAIGNVVGSIAPISRCFTILSFKSFAKQNWKHFLIFSVEKYWTQKLSEWKECRISFLSSGRRSRALHNLKNHILRFCIGVQKVNVVSCKIVGLIPIVVIICVISCSYYFKALKEMLYTPPTTTISDDRNEDDLSNYVLLLEDNMRLAKRTMEGISESMNRLIQNAEKKQHNNLLMLLEKVVAFNGVEAFDTDQVQSPLPVEHVNSWSLPVISLTCITIVLPNINKDMVDNLFRSVGEGLLYTHLVEESLNRESVYVNNRRAAVKSWHEVEHNYKWLEITLKRSAYEGKQPIEILKHFSHIAEEILNEFITTNGELMEKENLPSKIVIANSMYRITQTILHTYESNNLEIVEEDLFTRLSGMIADILAACLTNIPRVIAVRGHESAIEKRAASVKAAVDLFGRTTEIIKRVETCELPNMDLDKMGFIDEWHLHLKQL